MSETETYPAPKDKRLTEDEVVAQLRSGMTIGIGGWGSRRKPMSLVRAILRSDLTDLHLVTLREDFGYETLVFSFSTGLLKLHVEGASLSANVVVVPKERLSEFLDVA